MRLTALAVACCGLLTLAGCGIKGPLYLPQPPQPMAKPVPKQAPQTVDHNKPASQDSAP
ncbi:lipoprotein [Zoogloea sp.]|uniref:LPS translocon maturation chaperone LptM n=1 Tax=Zoogloea sp. TaxID=49181 RepID=UPI0035ADCAF2|nr:lipoprotein [Rhodocyclales bacterium]